MSSTPRASVHPLVPLHATLLETEEFLAYFEDTFKQTGVLQAPTILANLRAQIVVVRAAIESERVTHAFAAANAALEAIRAESAAAQAATTADAGQKGGA